MSKLTLPCSSEDSSPHPHPPPPPPQTHTHTHTSSSLISQHVKWVRAFTGAIQDLQAYVKKFHTTGLVWNKAVSIHSNSVHIVCESESVYILLCVAVYGHCTNTSVDYMQHQMSHFSIRDVHCLYVE